jgi:hypothetical protein
MNEQQLTAVKQALEALMVFRYAPPAQRPLVLKAITALLSIISQDALDKKAENARELGLTYDDAPAPVQSAERGEPVAWMDVDENGAMSSLRYWSEPDNRHEVALYTTPPIVATPLAAQQKRPQNCGTGYCSCIECVVEPVACDGWLQEGSLLYRLTDGRKPQNRDEINVTMADESRSVESRTRRAGELLDRIRATPPIVATPLAAQKPWVGLTDEDKHEIERKEKNT